MERTFLTSNGTKLALRPVAMLAMQMVRNAARKSLIDEGVLIPKPTYTFTTDLDETETHDHDKTTLKSKEDWAAWAAYEEGETALKMLVLGNTMRLLLIKGVDIPPMTEAERKVWEGLDIEFSDDPDTRFMEYVTLEHVPSPEEAQRLTRAILMLSQAGAPKAQVDAVDALFRRKVEGQSPKVPADA